jgi:protein O-GlcNAc transferase
MTSQHKVTDQLSAARILYRTCPLCAGSDIPAIRSADCSTHPLYHPSLPPTITWQQCRSCGHVFTDGYFTEEAEAVVFANVNPNQAVGHDAERARAVSARMVARVAQHVADGDWLDIGFGNASLLFTAAEWGFKPVGSDLRVNNVEVLRTIGYEVYAEPIEQLKDTGRFSVISMADVLEHMPQPRLGLEAAWRLLRSGGFMLLSMPNMDCMVWKVLDATNANPYWGELEHYHNFGRRRLYELLEEYGFVPVEYGISDRYRVCMEVIAKKP